MPYKKGASVFWTKPNNNVQLDPVCQRANDPASLFTAGANCLIECCSNCYFFMLILIAGANI